MGQWVHVIEEVDAETTTARCRNCGWVRYRIHKGRPKCSVAMRARKSVEGSREKKANGYMRVRRSGSWVLEHREVSQTRMSITRMATGPTIARRT